MLSNSRQEAGTSVHCLFSPFFFKSEVFSLSLGWEDPLEKEMAARSSTIAWKIPWTEEPGRLQSMGSQRVGHDWATPLKIKYSRLSWVDYPGRPLSNQLETRARSWQTAFCLKTATLPEFPLCWPALQELPASTIPKVNYLKISITLYIGR